MMGYFFEGSKSNGLYIVPYRSVMPSSAFTENGSGYRKPASRSDDTSVFSSSITLLPAESNRTDSGAESMRDELSTKNVHLSFIATACEAFPGFRSFIAP